MKRVISFLLVLVFCFSLACPAFAAVQSPGEHGPSHEPHRPHRPDRWWPSFLGDNPKTGDIILFWVAVMVVSVVALGAVYFVYRRKFAK